MAGGDYGIACASRDDIPDILVLQDENLPDRGGTLSVRLPSQWFEAALADMPLIVARKEERLAGYLVASSVESQAHIPVVQGMLRAYPPGPNAYIYGPICIAAGERGRGLPMKMFAAQRALVGKRDCITFIRRDNEISLRAHAKIGLHEVADYSHDGVALVVVACAG